MATTTTFRVGITLMAIFALMPVTSALSFWMGQDAVKSTSLQVKGSIDTSNPKITINLPKRLEEAKHIIKTFDSLPSCPKIATAALMHSCSSPHESMQSDADHVSHTSDALKAYGARLAVCELMEAHDASNLIPNDCQAFVPTHRTTKKQTMAGYVGHDGSTEPTLLYPSYEKLTKNNLDRCVRGLAQEPQSWSSYSNAKQNAVVICHSVHAELQMEQSVKTYEKIVNSFGGIVENYEHMAQEYEAQLADVRAATKGLVQNLHDQWTRIYSTMDADVSEFTKALQDQLLHILANASDITQSSLQTAKQAATDLNQDIAAISKQAGYAATQVEYTGQFVEQRLMQQLGRVLHDLGLQQDLIQYSNEEFSQLAVGLLEAVSQVNRTNDQLATTETFAQSLRDQLHQANQDVEKFNQNVGYLANFVSYGWSGAIRKVSLFIASVTVLTPLTFGFWERLVGLSFLGNCGAALSSGLAFGMASAYYVDPATFFQEYPADIFEGELGAHKHILIGLLIGIIGTLAVGMLYSTLRRCFTKTEKLYDPASPSIEVDIKKEYTWGV